MMKFVLPLAGMLALAACSASQQAASTAQVQHTLADAQHSLDLAVRNYGVAKGLALVAEAAYPQLTPYVDRAVAVIEPLIASAKLLLASADTDVPQVQALASQINGQVAALTVTAAPAVTVTAH